MELMTRQYPVGIQTFERIIRDGYICVDKTDTDMVVLMPDTIYVIVHYLTNGGPNKPLLSSE